MPIAAAQPDTVADLLHDLGDVPPERVLFQPVPGTATEADVVRLLESKKRRCELVDGVLVEKVMGWFEGRLAFILGYFLEAYLDDNDCGVTCGSDGPHRLWVGRVRFPDVGFTRYESLPESGEVGAIASWVPDLAVEILSKSNTRREMKRKLRDYFKAGVKLVWYVNPRKRTVRVYHGPSMMTSLTEDDTLDGEQILPGFQLSIRTWFERADRARRGRSG